MADYRGQPIPSGGISRSNVDPFTGILAFGDNPYNNVIDIKDSATTRTREHPAEEDFKGSDVKQEPRKISATLAIFRENQDLRFSNSNVYNQLKGFKEEGVAKPLNFPSGYLEDAVISKLDIEPQSPNFAELKITFKQVEYVRTKKTEKIENPIEEQEEGENGDGSSQKKAIETPPSSRSGIRNYAYSEST